MDFIKKVFGRPEPTYEHSYHDDGDDELEILVKQQIPDKGPELDLDKMFLNFLAQEFGYTGDIPALQPAVQPMAPPLFILRSKESQLSVWYRLPLKGESGTLHIPDFVVFRGNYRTAPRDKNPDIIVECRNLIDDLSNRTDLRVVQDVIGRSLEVLPGTCVLLTNRELSGYARGLAEKYGIGLVELDNTADPGYRLFKTLVSDEQLTRDKFTSIVNKSLNKMLLLQKKTKRTLGAHEAMQKGTVHDRVYKVIQTHPGSTVAEISSVIGIHDNFIVNALYLLEKEKKAKITKHSNQPNSHRYHEWSAVKPTG
ncbi:MAG: hypothetical protein ABIG20_03940 [archaeon]